MRYNVDVREILIKSVSVDTDSIQDAKDKVKEMYKNQEIVLDYSDFTGDVDCRVSDENFNPLEEWDENGIQ